jgi:putative DNA primase/helicase
VNSWHHNAELLGCWAYEMVVNRVDACGAYFEQDGVTKSYTDKKHPVTQSRLIDSFRATSSRDLIGLHALGTDNCGRWAAIDIDLHEGDKISPSITKKFAVETYRRLHAFKPLLHESNGKGGYHLRVHFQERVSGDVLFLFAKYMAQGWENYFAKMPETFPKQPRIEEGKFGNWLRLVGRHHKRDYYPEVMTPKGWKQGELAVQHILTHTGVPAEKILPKFLEKQEQKQEQVHRQWEVRHGRGMGVQPWEEFDQTVSWESLLTGWGWKKCSSSGDVTYWTRPGKDSDISASLGFQSDGTVPLLFVFTTNADPLPPWKYYKPSDAYAWVHHRGDFKASNQDLRNRGYGKSGVFRAEQSVPRIPGNQDQTS